MSPKKTFDTATERKQIAAVPDLSQDQIALMARHVAEQHAMNGKFNFLPDGSKLYHVPEGWESQTLAKSPDVSVCNSILSLEAAFRDASRPVILIESNALLTAHDINKVCSRTNSVKTLFKIGERS